MQISDLADGIEGLDEPSIGMHPHDITRMNDLLLRLRDKGNTVLVVEHKPEVIAIAEHVVDLGPLAGAGGGEVVFEGSIEALRASGTLTGRHLGDRAAVKPTVRKSSGALEVRGADTHNLKSIDVDIPLGVLVVVTGVAGSGKSSLIGGSVSGREGVVEVDQTAIKGSRRSNPATYTKARRRHAMRGLRGQAVSGRGARVHFRRQEHRRRAGHVGRRSRAVLWRR